MNSEKISAGSIIFVGKGGPRAVISQVIDKRKETYEVVYYDNKGEAINEDVQRRNGIFEFMSEGPCGGYAKNIPRLAEYLAILKNTKY